MINIKTIYYNVNVCLNDWDGGSLEYFCGRCGDSFLGKCVPQWNTAYVE